MNVLDAIEDFFVQYNVGGTALWYLIALVAGFTLLLVIGILLGLSTTVILSPTAIWSRMRTLHGIARFGLSLLPILAVCAILGAVGGYVVHLAFGLQDPAALQMLMGLFVGGLVVLVLSYTFIVIWQRVHGVPSDGKVGLTFDEVFDDGSGEDATTIIGPALTEMPAASEEYPSYADTMAMTQVSPVVAQPTDR